MKSAIIVSSILLGLTAAKPLDSGSPQISKRGADPGSVKILTTIAPKSASCSGGDFPAECITAADAAQPLIDSFLKYKISTPGEQAALLSWMAYESGEFKYIRNHFPAPGRPGQGTRAMMMPNFVSQYATSLQLSNSDPAGLLDDAIKAGGEWGAASWFYSTQCSDSIKAGVKKGDKASWQAFVTQCVQTTLDSGANSREVYWTRAATALGLSGN